MNARKISLGILATAAVVGSVTVLAITQFNPSARQKPGRLETAVMQRVKFWAIQRRASAPTAQLERTPENLRSGRSHFEEHCAVCHGLDGRGQSLIGRGLNPPAPDLASPSVQAWRDADLFWIIQNGIRFTGMPGFEDTHSDTETLQLVLYVREFARMSDQDRQALLEQAEESNQGHTHAPGEEH